MGHLSSLSRTGRWMLHSFPGLPWEQEGLREMMGSAQTLRPPQTPRSRGTGQEEHRSPGLQHPPHPPQAAQENCRRHTRSCHLSPPSYGTAYPRPLITAEPRPQRSTLQKPVHFCSRKLEGKFSQKG